MSLGSLGCDPAAIEEPAVRGGRSGRAVGAYAVTKWRHGKIARMDDAVDPDVEAIPDDDEEEDGYEEDEDKDTTGWIPRIIYEPWAFSGDLPEPDEVLRRHPHLADDPQWAIYLIGSDDGDIEVSESGLTLAEARRIEDGVDDDEDDTE